MARKKTRSFAELRERKPEERYKRREVHVPEWGTSVFARQMSGNEFQKITEISGGEDVNVSQMAEILAIAVEDHDGEHPDVDWLRDEPFAILKMLTDEVMKANGLDPETIEEREKNS